MKKTFVPRARVIAAFALQVAQVIVEYALHKRLELPLGPYIVLCLLLHHYSLLVYDQFLPLFPNRAEITRILNKMRGKDLPEQIKPALLRSLENELDRMVSLINQEPVHVFLKTQYTYASGIAEYYSSRPVDTIYATALDSPSEFITKHIEYFDIQTGLNAKSDQGYKVHAKIEASNISLILKHSYDSVERNFGPPEKARIVVIEKANLLKELTLPGFWAFIDWHVENKVGLKFFVRQGDPTYEGLLMRRTGINTPEHTIDDFIVYGNECVFGRVNPEPVDDVVKLGFHYAGNGFHDPDSIVSRYVGFFTYLWDDKTQPRTHTLTELWAAFPEVALLAEPQSYLKALRPALRRRADE